MSSLVEEFKYSKVRLEMTLTESRDPYIAQRVPVLRTGAKWTPYTAVQQAKSAIKHRDIIGHVQQGRGGLGLGDSRPSWHKSTISQHRKLVVEEVCWQEQAMRWAKAVSQAKHG